MRNVTPSRAAFFFLASLPLLAGCAVDPSPAGELTDHTTTALSGAATSPSSAAVASSSGIATSPGLVAAPITPITPIPLPVAAPAPVVRAIATGAAWQHVTVTGTALDGVSGATVSVTGEYTVIHGRAAIGSSDLSSAAQSALAASMATSAQVAGVDEIIIVPKATADAAVATSISEPADGRSKPMISICSDSDETYSKDYSINNAWSYAKTTDGHGFTGNLSVNAGVAVRFTGNVDYTIKRHLYFGCIPYAVVHSVSAVGAGTVTADLVANATFAGKWSDEETIADPTLGTITLPGVPIPITFTLPIRVGLDAAAQASLTANASFSAIGSYTIACNSSGCDGTKEGVYGFQGNQPPSVSVSANVKVTPYAEAALHASVISDWLASAEVGLRASLPTNLFGYVGNGCGDANGDGVNEWVTGLSVDMGVSADVRASAEFLGSDYGPWSWNVWTQHVGFWPVNGGVFDPMVTGTAGGFAVTMQGRMRPCYPFTDAMSYLVTWSDGSTSNVSSAPSQARFSEPHHTFATAGVKPISVEAVSDAAGRTIGTSATRDVDAFYIQPIPITILRADHLLVRNAPRGRSRSGAPSAGPAGAPCPSRAPPR